MKSLMLPRLVAAPTLLTFLGCLAVGQEPLPGNSQRRLSEQLIESFSFYTTDRRVEIKGIHRSSNGTRTASDEALRQTSYWPTAARWLSDDRLGIAGRNIRGRTVVEVWTIQPPVLFTDVSPSGGGTTINLDSPRILRVDTVYDGELSGQGMVSSILPIASTEDILVQFSDTADIFRLSSEEGVPPALVVDASVAASQGAQFHVPMAYAASEVWWGDHPLHGNVYVFRREVSGTFKIALIDDDRDGAFEDIFVTTGYAAWKAQQLDAFDVYSHIEKDQLVD